MMRRRNTVKAPTVFADLALEFNGQWATIDVERQDWLKDHGHALESAERVGLILRGKKRPAIWLTPNGGTPEYFSRVLGHINMDGNGDGMQGAVRVAGLRCGGVQVWLHRDGLVEVGPEPSYREV